MVKKKAISRIINYFKKRVVSSCLNETCNYREDQIPKNLTATLLFFLIKEDCTP